LPLGTLPFSALLWQRLIWNQQRVSLFCFCENGLLKASLFKFFFSFVCTRYMGANGAIPAYEFNFDDVNPPVHVLAVWKCYRKSQEIAGDKNKGDRQFLATCFHKLLLNWSWWINRKDTEGHGVLGGGFLGLDNISVKVFLSFFFFFVFSECLFRCLIARIFLLALSWSRQMEQLGVLCFATTCSRLQWSSRITTRATKTLHRRFSNILFAFLLRSTTLEALDCGTKKMDSTTTRSNTTMETRKFFVFAVLLGEDNERHIYLCFYLFFSFRIVPIFSTINVAMNNVKEMRGLQKRTEWFLQSKPHLRKTIKASSTEAHLNHAHAQKFPSMLKPVDNDLRLPSLFQLSLPSERKFEKILVCFRFFFFFFVCVVLFLTFVSEIFVRRE
jgi:hypothetical protein